MVKIKRIFIKNLTILKEVMGKDEIEIIFTDNQLCFIVGKNGSGKSFIMSLITPAPIDLVKNRSGNPSIPDKEGIKEIDIELDYKYLYKCKIIYGKGKTSCFITKDNILTNESLGELNPNGNVNSYYEVLEKELGWSKTYINIGYLSSGVTSLINMRQGERSDYMTEWLPQLSEYIDAHKVVSKKANLIKRQIDMLNNDIGKLSGTDYDVLINNYENNIVELNKKYLIHLDYQSRCESYYRLYPVVYKDELDKRLKDLKNICLLMNQEKTEILDERLLISKYTGEKGKKLLEDSISKCDYEISTLSEKLSNNEETLLSLRNEMNEIYNENDFNSSENILDIEASLKSINFDIEDLEKTKETVLKRNPEYKEIENVSKVDIDIFSSFIEDLYELRNNITSHIDNSLLNNMELIYNGIENLNKSYDIYNERVTGLDIKIMQLSNKIYGLKNSNMNKELLDLRPPECKISCGIVNEIIKYIDPENEIKILQYELTKVINEKSELLSLIDKLSNDKHNISIGLNLITDMNSKIMRQKDLISKFPEFIRNIFEDPDVCVIINGIPNISDKINDFRDYIYLIEKLRVTKDVQYTTSATYKIMKQQKNIEVKWSKMHEKYTEMAKNRDILIQNFEASKDLEKRLKSIESIKIENDNKLKDFNERVDGISDDKKNLKKMATTYYLKNILESYISKLGISIIRIKNELDEIKSKLDIIKNKKNSMQTLIETRDNLSYKKKRYDILADIWSPKTGYPSWEMEDFLDALTEQTNSDLEKMWGANFKIESFNIGASEFSIPINRDGIIINDASECSDGERATLSLAISFAIIEINLKYKKYNVLRFDEIDGPLDSERRRSFIEMVMNRLPSLDCGNLFIISHNNEFADVPADLIILSELEESTLNLTNKIIVYTN